uniref:Uncharacterized protein n=1 Tax=Palpitomonas bilix TaxID=652834 RepID=A0A7S3GHQ0_9EUKA|mmetsp:Transcript_49920/g.128454  ORF Transcript_49920/g.128454 Transcript_49920/m.128454 type:complete len:728 (+) Transcript_49920:231-2414(+)
MASNLQRSSFSSCLLFLLCSFISSTSAVVPTSHFASKLAEIDSEQPSHNVVEDDVGSYFSILPGIGFNPLTGEATTQLFSLSYTEGKVLPDSTFLIPDEVDGRIVKQQKVSQLATTTSDVYEAFSSTSTKSSVGWSVLGLFGGQLSIATNNEKKLMVENDLTALTISNFMHMYDLHLSSRQRRVGSGVLLHISSAVCALSRSHPSQAYFAISRMIGMYGPAWMDRVQLGFRSDLREYGKFNSTQIDTKTSVEQAASFGFMGMFNMKQSYSTSEEAYAKYSSKLESSTVSASGCGVWKPGMPYDSWLATCETGRQKRVMKGGVKGSGNVGMGDALLSNSFLPIYNLISPAYLPPNINPVYLRHLEKVRGIGEEMVQRLVFLNKRSGCMDTHSPNFKMWYNANNPKQCKESFPSEEEIINHYQYGGFYSVSQYEVEGSFAHIMGAMEADVTEQNKGEGQWSATIVHHANGITGGASCAENYDDVLLYTHREEVDKWTMDGTGEERKLVRIFQLHVCKQFDQLKQWQKKMPKRRIPYGGAYSAKEGGNIHMDHAHTCSSMFEPVPASVSTLHHVVLDSTSGLIKSVVEVAEQNDTKTSIGQSDADIQMVEARVSEEMAGLTFCERPAIDYDDSSESLFVTPFGGLYTPLAAPLDYSKEADSYCAKGFHAVVLATAFDSTLQPLLSCEYIDKSMEPRPVYFPISEDVLMAETGTCDIAADVVDDRSSFAYQ